MIFKRLVYCQGTISTEMAVGLGERRTIMIIELTRNPVRVVAKADMYRDVPTQGVQWYE